MAWRFKSQKLGPTCVLIGIVVKSSFSVKSPRLTCASCCNCSRKLLSSFKAVTSSPVCLLLAATCKKKSVLLNNPGCIMHAHDQQGQKYKRSHNEIYTHQNLNKVAQLYVVKSIIAIVIETVPLTWCRSAHVWEVERLSPKTACPLQTAYSWAIHEPNKQTQTCDFFTLLWTFNLSFLSNLLSFWSIVLASAIGAKTLSPLLLS